MHFTIIITYCAQSIGKIDPIRSRLHLHYVQYLLNVERRHLGHYSCVSWTELEMNVRAGVRRMSLQNVEHVHDERNVLRKLLHRISAEDALTPSFLRHAFWSPPFVVGESRGMSTRNPACIVVVDYALIPRKNGGYDVGLFKQSTCLLRRGVR